VNVLLVAEESAGIQTLRMLARTEHRIAGVLTAPPTRGGGATVASVAETLGVPVLESKRVKDPALADWMREREIDLLLNVHSLYLIHGDVVAAPRIGAFNLHPGPLPRMAGLNCPSWAIYEGEPRHAVTLHWMEAGIDTGDIAYEAAFDLSEKDTGLSVSVRCVKEGLPLVARLLEAAARGRDTIPRIRQDVSERRYYGREAPEGGRIVWSRPARELVGLVRASDYSPFPSPWGQPRASLEARPVAVTRAVRTGEPAGDAPGAVAAAPDGAVRVAAGDEWVLVERVQLNGKPVAAAEVLQPGMRLGDGE
jgi:UDP-4-amino-4-deoxy-L-arabinose formyltransferase/UDP-glucuronic acid dehydrogenase (UDP-4-keto-hexauronic acid decarboxylating)